MDATDLPLPEMVRAGDERTTLTDMLGYYRVVLERKALGLTDQQLDQRLAPSSLTIGGLLVHMALVEDWWFDHLFIGRPEREPWASVQWDEDPDWELNNAHLMNGDEQRRLFTDAVARSQRTTSASSSLDQHSAKTRESDGQPWNLRWIMVHMIEEYARHCGHADFLRQAIDGASGD